MAELTLRAGFKKYVGFTRLEEYGTISRYDSARWTREEYIDYQDSFYKQRVEDL